MKAIVSREAFQECGPFDTSLGRIGSEFSNLLSGEETSLFRNMREKGWRLFYAPGAIVRHRIGVKRMTQAWVRRRMAWQAVADQMMSPLKPDEILPAFVGLMQYVQLVPPQHRAFMGLLWDTPDPDLFKKQIIALMYAMKLFLATGAYPQEIRFNP